MIHFAFVRHGESTVNAAVAAGQTDYSTATHVVPLTDLGHQQAIDAGVRLRSLGLRFDAAYTSYYWRAKHTAGHILRLPPRTKGARWPRIELYEDARLAEQQRGIWHQMPRAEIEKAFPTEIARSELEGYYHYRPLGGENWPDVELRIRSWMRDVERDLLANFLTGRTGDHLTRLNSTKTVLIVGHGHWFSVFARLLSGEDPLTYTRPILGNGEIVLGTWDELTARGEWETEAAFRERNKDAWQMWPREKST